VQALQLVRGGRDAALTARPTLTVLELLAAKKLLPSLATQELAAAYVFLRRVEHRLQYWTMRRSTSCPQARTIASGLRAWRSFRTGRRF
jgi:glutamate-ammonia-ligase adenylyltransferase